MTGFIHSHRFWFKWAVLPVSLVAIVVGLLSGASALASQQVELYSVQALVKSQSESDRNAAARAAFSDVLVRVSGRKDVVNHEDVAQAIRKAHQYLFGFSYQNVTATLGDEAVPAIGLAMQFDSAAVEQLLRSAHMPLWPSTRPQVLVWVVMQDKDGLRVLTPDEQTLLQKQSAYRGLPLTFPRWDMEDALYLSSQQLWEGWVSEVKAASSRYQADAILVGRITPSSLGQIPLFKKGVYLAEASEEVASGASSSSVSEETLVPEEGATEEPAQEMVIGPFLGDWLLIQNENEHTFAGEFPALAELLGAAVDESADFLSKLYAISPQASEEASGSRVLRIGNITSFAAFKQAQDYLRSIAMVKAIDVISVNSDGVLVRLAVEGDLRLLTSTLALGRRLVPVESSRPQSTNELALDESALQELELALANELSELGDDQVVSEQVETPESLAPTQQFASGTLDDPLMYNWQ